MTLVLPLWSAAACAAAPLTTRFIWRYAALETDRKKQRICALLIALLGGGLGCAALLLHGLTVRAALIAVSAYCAVGLSLTDVLCFEIPPVFNLLIAACSAGLCWLDRANLSSHLLGAAVFGGILLLICLFSKGRALGGGDVKLMFAACLGLGFGPSAVAFLAAFPLAAVIHAVRMLVFHQGNRLAFGPYLSAGIVFAYLFGDQLADWYLSLMVF